ncbi:S-adenosyl-L-methionine-dependent methyltransferase [Serendipita vermifera]|nr:S-adenosyl-L-methionine-dependent methyltransferase [Serendipita vermifera]
MQSVRPAVFRRLVRKFGREDAVRQVVSIQKELLARPKPRPSLTGQVYRLVRDEPLPYVLGTQPFGSLQLQIAPPVLVPRPETAEWVDELLKRVKKDVISLENEQRHWKMLDLCTGAGPIPLLLLNDWPNYVVSKCSAYGVEIGDEALVLAETNKQRLLPKFSQIQHPSQQGVPFQALKMDILSKEFEEWLNSLGKLDIFTSNPPYTSHFEWVHLHPSMKDYEDPRALKGGDDGMNFFRRIAEILQTHKPLRPDGYLALEFGKGQGPYVKKMIDNTKIFYDVEIWNDASDTQRSLFARAK